MRFALLYSAFAAGSLLHAQYSAAFSDETRPRLFKADLTNGRITVKGVAGNEVSVVVEGGGGGRPPVPPPKDRGGWTRVDAGAATLTERGNVVTLGGAARLNGSLVIQVPHKTSLQISCVNCGAIRVEDVDGDLDINNVNGAIRLFNVGGSILAHSLNSSIEATISRIDPMKPHSFSSMNGAIVCTFPADLKANVKMRTENGNIHTDFDVRLAGGTTMRTDRGIAGTIGGGGPEIQLKAFNGSITLRKK